MLFQFYIGGLPNVQEGLVVTQNYTGCFENLYLNTTNIIRDLKDSIEEGLNFKYDKVNTRYSCPEPPIVPVTFLTPSSYAKLKGYEGMTTLNVSFAFRTYEEGGVLLYHDFMSTGYVKVS